MRKLVFVTILVAALLASCGGESVLWVAASGDVSAVYTESGTSYIWGGVAFEPTLSPDALDVDDKVVGMVSGSGFVLWRTPHTLYGSGRRDLLPIGDSATERMSAASLLAYDGEASTRYDTALCAIAPITRLAAGESFTLALREDGTVWTWGLNNYEQLGAATVATSSTIPLKIERLTGIRRIAASGRLSAALDMDGNVWTWGGAAYDPHGDRVLPQVMENLPQISEIYVSDSGYAALDKDGNLWTWSAAEMDNRHIAPLPAVTAAAVCGDSTIAAIDAAKQLWLLLPNATESTLALTDVSQVAAGASHILALKSDGSLYAYGDNSRGQLGLGHTDKKDGFVAVSVR